MKLFTNFPPEFSIFYLTTRFLKSSLSFKKILCGAPRVARKLTILVNKNFFLGKHIYHNFNANPSMIVNRQLIDTGKILVYDHIVVILVKDTIDR